jgi:excinuclease ABC subunit C
MEESEQLHFEAAAKIRDQIAHIEKVIEKQKIVSTDFMDQDVIGLHRQDPTLVVYPLFIRAGKVLGGKGFAFSVTNLPEEELLDSFLHQYYRQGKFIPDHVLLPISIPDQELLQEWLTELKGKKVRILVPERGEKKHLLGMANENAEKFLRTESRSNRTVRSSNFWGGLISKATGKLRPSISRTSMKLPWGPWWSSKMDWPRMTIMPLQDQIG